MGELISIILIIVAISKILGKAGNAASQVEQLDKRKSNWGTGSYQFQKQASRVESARVQVQRQTQQAVQEQIARTKQRILQSRGVQDEENEHLKQANMHRQQENRQAMQQVHDSRVEAQDTTILQRAKANAEEDRVDVTLETMEAEHNHSERVSAAVHQHPEDVIPESMLGNIEDLMIKGYDGNLCFERDFLGEAMDMISRFTVPSDVPDFSKDDVA